MSLLIELRLLLPASLVWLKSMSALISEKQKLALVEQCVQQYLMACLDTSYAADVETVLMMVF